MMIAAILAVTLMILCPSTSAIPGYALSPLMQDVEQCTHALSTVVQLGDTTLWLERPSDAIYESTSQPVSAETSLAVYITTKTRSAAHTCPVSSKPSRTATESLLTIEGPVAIQAGQVVDDASKTLLASTDSTTPVNTTLRDNLKFPTCAATAFNKHPPNINITMMADQQPGLSSELEATLAPQVFRLVSLLDHRKSSVNKRYSK